MQHFLFAALLFVSNQLVRVALPLLWRLGCELCARFSRAISFRRWIIEPPAPIESDCDYGAPGASDFTLTDTITAKRRFVWIKYFAEWLPLLRSYTDCLFGDNHVSLMRLFSLRTPYREKIKCCGKLFFYVNISSSGRQSIIYLCSFLRVENYSFQGNAFFCEQYHSSFTQLGTLCCWNV